MEQQQLHIGAVSATLWGAPAQKLYLYVHGQGGNKEEAAGFAAAACAAGWQVLSIDLPGHGARPRQPDAFDPWHAVPELQQVMAWARPRWGPIALRATSIGAWFSMLAFAEQPLARCLFVSPVLDMERLIRNMMQWAGVSPAQLEKEGAIPTEFGQTLSWEYLLYAQAHPITRWASPTFILYAGGDGLTERGVVDDFCARFGCGLAVMEEGEHWFHTPEQLRVLARWEQQHL